MTTKKINNNINKETIVLNPDLITFESIKEFSSIIIDVTLEKTYKVKIGKFFICTIPFNNVQLLDILNEYKGSIFLYTKYKELLKLENKKEYYIEIGKTILDYVEESSELTCADNIRCNNLQRSEMVERESNNLQRSEMVERQSNNLQRSEMVERQSNNLQRSEMVERQSNNLQRSEMVERQSNNLQRSEMVERQSNNLHVWLCNVIDRNDQNYPINISEKCERNYKNIPIVEVIYAKCNNSMIFLDKLHRNYINKHKFKKNEIVAIQSVAGSGKTTTLLELAKIHSTKRILYLAFNKSLIVEIKDKIGKQKINNLFPVTFDALMREVFIMKTKIEDMCVVDLKPQTLPNVMDWFSNKPYSVKDFYTKAFMRFCNQIQYKDIKEFSIKILGNEKKLLNEMWKMALHYQFITFDSIRKMVEMNAWCVGYIDNKYDMIFIDESQDFDGIMLKILLEHTTLPKLFVGDPNQAIYEWRGCINAFDRLPPETLFLQFYSTFRVGNPACEFISEKFGDIMILSKSENMTIVDHDVIPLDPYVYLFRSWKCLLQTAQELEKIWIYNFDGQIDMIKKLHNKLQFAKLDEEEMNEFSDDLPRFLLSLSKEDLQRMIQTIERNMICREQSHVQMYTIHSYKGLENDIVRIYNDIDIQKERNLYYVALTRGKKQILLDTAKTNAVANDKKDNKTQMFFIKGKKRTAF